MFSLDAALAININALTNASPWIANFAIFSAIYLPYIVCFLLVLYVIKDLKKVSERGHAVLVAFLAALIARYPLKMLIVLGYTFTRPYVTLHEITLLIPPILTEENLTFPSGHTLFFFAMAAVLYVHNKKLGMLYYAAALLIGCARIMVGVHYPSDIIGGIVFGILVGLLCSKLIYAYGSRFGFRSVT